MIVTLNFQNNNYETQYEAVAGSVFSDEYNEQLDSAKIILSNISVENRLSNLQCFERVLVNYGETKYMLVDNYVENILNLEDGKEVYDYTIALMSYTKFLERIQLPNRMLNLSLVTGRKTINQVITEMVDLYIPKCKVQTSTSLTYSYKSIISFPTYDKFDVPCPYFQWNKPTLRTALTSLMNSVGCLPIVKGGILTYIDLNATPTEFDTTYCNYVTRSNSSDSYINTLSMQPQNVLDEENYTIVENIGFRDGNSVYLKQKENLILQTRMPIYDIKKVNYIIPLKESATLVNYSYNGYFKVSMQIKNLNGSYTVRFQNNVDGLITSDTIKFSGVTVTAFRYDNNGNIVYDKTLSIGDVTLADESTSYKYGTISPYYSYSTATYSRTYFCVSCGTVDYVTPSLDPDQRIALMDNQYIKQKYYDSIGGTMNYNSYDSTPNSYPKEFIYYRNYVKDVTDLFKEKKKRVVLETNFTAMEDETFTSVEDMAKYIYSTVQYTVGSKKITGFSETYTVSYGFFDSTKTYIENITNELFGMDQDGDKFDICEYFGGIPKMQYSEYGNYEPNVDIVTNRTTEFSSTTSSGLFSYPLLTSILFSIEYQPMNSFHIKYPKSNINAPYILEQLDNQSSSIPQFDDLSVVEQNKVDRVGNEVFSINQRITDLSYLQPVNSLYGGDKIVFKRKISLYEDCAIVQYTASKDYVLRNFYTSIATKYRAYEYSDYEGTVKRYENTLIYCCLDNYYFKSDDKLTFSDVSLKIHLIDGCVPHTEDNRIRYNILDSTTGTYYKNDLSVISDKYNFLFVYEDYDSNSFGISLKNKYDATEGGVAQTWEIMDEDYWKTHYVYFTTDFEEEKLSYVYSTESEMENIITAVSEMPLIEFDPDAVDYIKFNTNFNKYVNEIINHTVQLHFYSNNPRIEWTKNFLNLCSLKTADNGTLKIVINSTSDLEEDEYTKDKYYGYNIGTYVTTGYVQTDIPYIRIDWGKLATTYSLMTIENIKIVQSLENGKYLDIIKFTKDTSSLERYYLSLNDTKSEIVYANSSLLQPVGKIAHNSTDRSFNEY